MSKLSKIMSRFFLSKLLLLFCFAGGSTLYSELDDIGPIDDDIQVHEDDPSARDSPDAIVVDDGSLAFYFIETVIQRDRPQLYVQTEGEFQAIRPAFGGEGPLHQLDAESHIVFYERVSVEEDGEVTWQHLPRYIASLQDHNGGKIVVFLPRSNSQPTSPGANARPLRWIELSRDLYDFGEIAVINPFEQQIAMQIDGQNVMLEPGQSHKRPFRMSRGQTASVHIRIAMRLRAGDFQEMLNERVFMFEGWRGVFIPFFDHVSGNLSLVKIRERPPE